MTKSIALFLFFNLFFMGVWAQTSQKLTGQIIGTKNYYEYSNNSCIAVSTIPNTAFDGNLSNTFATCEVTGGWVGYDLGEPHIITRIAYAPRENQPSRMLLGLFEGANHPDFGDAIPLHLIQTTPEIRTLTWQTIHSSRGFRYVRYIGPANAKCNVAELEFHGYKGAGNNLTFPKTTNLATVIIHTTNAEDIVVKDTYIKGIISVINENGTSIYTDSLEIKGRGNVSWEFPKKPYRLKLYNKTNLLGLPAKEKNWTLINNYGDKTLMRNLLAFHISRSVDISYTPAGIPVDVFLNGEYKGTYQLCDQLEVAPERVIVEKMRTTDIVAPEITGGYLIEMDAYANREISWFTSAQNQIPVTIKYPKDDEIVPQQSAYIKAHFEAMEAAINAPNYADNTHGFRRLFDVDTFLRHFLVGELSGNTDTYWSTYMYKKRNDSKFYFGPVWDFDIAFENDFRTFPINSNPEWIYNSKGSAANGVRNLVNRVFSDKQVVDQLRAMYSFYRNNGKISPESILQVVDAYAAKINHSQRLNFIKWNILNTKVHMNPHVFGSYAAEVENVKNFIRGRIAWMDTKLNYVPLSTTDLEHSNIYSWSNHQVLHVVGAHSNAKIEIVDASGSIRYKSNASEQTSFKLQSGIYVLRVFVNNTCVHLSKCVIY